MNPDVIIIKHNLAFPTTWVGTSYHIMHVQHIYLSPPSLNGIVGMKACVIFAP